MIRALGRIGMLTAPILLITACSGTASSSVSTASSAPSTAPSLSESQAASMHADADRTVTEAKKVVGMPEAEAIAQLEQNINHPMTTRVVSRDGQDYPVTMDFSPNRVNLTIENGVVTNVSVG